ncbi:LLM class flavin-dependent oxidoreductase [Streptomyces sp. NPDC051636]|uniref:LLM class flavin-dependent oxidoreductase n=1 Tax=Streptomyces sp. NPDC051636 TaxID=3365663 RepID=UPI00379181B5
MANRTDSKRCGSRTTTTRGTTRRARAAFVWSVIGALSEAVSLPIETAVACPTVRIHPAVVAQAAATSAVMTGGRFRLGVGTGEALNERPSPTPTSTASTSTRSAPTSAASSTSTVRRCCRS